MTNLINKILAIFQLKLVSTKPVSLVEETVKFLNTTKYSGGLCGAHDVDITKEIPHDYYFGDIIYVADKDGKSYIRQTRPEEKYFCDKEENLKAYLENKVDKVEETVFTAEELQEKL
jgi:hypothetical protein